MSPTPAADPERNRELIAARLAWPPGAIDVCRRLEKTYPRWTVFWTSGSQTATEPGYRAILWQHDHRAELYAATAEEILAQLVKVDAEVPPPFNELPPYAPLV